MGPDRPARPISRSRISLSFLPPLLLTVAPPVAATLVGLALRRAPVRDAVPRAGLDVPLERSAPAPRAAAWAERLAPVDVVSFVTGRGASVRLYARDGEVDDQARAAFERVAAGDAQAHALSVRLEQLVVRAAYHFDGAAIVVVSAWRDHASRHGTGEAIDFKLKGIRASRLAAYLRSLPRAGVGLYTHPETQFVHLDVRDRSFHWVDASPPGVKWREAALRDPHAALRDASWTPEGDLP